MLATIRQRNFALLWLAGLISLTGDWILRVALPFYVFQLTGSALSTGLILMANTLPGVLFSSLAGVLVDRWNRRRVLIVACLLQGVLLVLMFPAMSVDRLWIIYAIAFVQSLVAQFFGLAENALLPQLVQAEYLSEANSLNALNNNLALLIGPAVGGVLLGVLGLSGVIVIDIVSFVLGALMIGLIRIPTSLPSEQIRTATLTGRTTSVRANWGTFWREWREGLHLIGKHRVLSTVFVSAGFAVLGEGIFAVLLIPFVAKLDGGAIALGWLLTVRGLGGLLGGLVIGLASRFVPPNRLFPICIGAVGFLSLIMYNASALIWPMVILFLIGLPAMGAQISSNTLFQRTVSDLFRGRVFGAFGATVAFLMMMGQALATALGDSIGIVVMLNVGACLYILAGCIAMWMMLRVSTSTTSRTQNPA
jgi:MFS family permease